MRPAKLEREVFKYGLKGEPPQVESLPPLMEN
jgi:hypothetical protein